MENLSRHAEALRNSGWRFPVMAINLRKGLTGVNWNSSPVSLLYQILISFQSRRNSCSSSKTELRILQDFELDSTPVKPKSRDTKLTHFPSSNPIQRQISGASAISGRRQYLEIESFCLSSVPAERKCRWSDRHPLADRRLKEIESHLGDITGMFIFSTIKGEIS